jgi:hypothetical protein
MRVVPLVGLSVSICALFDRVGLGANYFFKLFQLHSLCAKFGNVQRCRFVIIVRKAMRRVIESALEVQLLSLLIHFLEKVEHIYMVFEVGGARDVGRSSNCGQISLFLLASH